MGETSPTLEQRIDAISRVWGLYAEDWQAALDDALANHPERAFEERASVVLLAWDTAQRWAHMIAADLGISEEWVWSDPQFRSTFVMDETDEMLELGVDVTDPDHIKLFWTTALCHGSTPHPLPDYDTALAAAREYLVAPDPARPELL